MLFDVCRWLVVAVCSSCVLLFIVRCVLLVVRSALLNGRCGFVVV